MDQFAIIASFSFFLIAFTVIGVLASRVKKSSSEDYLVASRNVNPWLVALSAVSTNNSGYMFIGLIGYTWRNGIDAMWIMFGWITGDLLSWLWVHERVRARSEQINAASVSELLATDNQNKLHRPIAVVAGILTFLFLGGYAAAQLKAGSTALHAIFGAPVWLGSLIGVIIVAIYSVSGGIRASIWTDAAQSGVMVVTMAILLVYCAVNVGGPVALLDRLGAMDSAFVDPVPRGLAFGLGLYVLGYLFAGLATVGQPHVLVRFMAISSVKAIAKARTVYFTWYILFSVMSVFVGLYARVLMPDLGDGLTGQALLLAAEGALPSLALKLLPSVLVGVMLAGLFAATMSTADSQILSCSAAITQDVVPRWSQSYLALKISTLSVASFAFYLAVADASGVFELVLKAWSALGAAIGPVLVIRLANRPLSTPTAITMMCSGLLTVFLWDLWAVSNSIVAVLPGMLVPLVVYGVVQIMDAWRQGGDNKARS